MFPLPKPIMERIESHHSKFYRVLKTCLNIKGERILVISDGGVGENALAAMMGYGYYSAAKKEGMDAELHFQEMREGFMQAEKNVQEALESLPQESVILLSVSDKLGLLGKRKSFRSFCQERGHRFLSVTGLGSVKAHNFDLFLEAMNVNYNRMNKVGQAIKKKWDQANEIRVKSEAGTDLKFDVAGMKAVANVGLYHEKGSGGNMPAGEVYIPPRGYHGVEGVLVVDGSLKIDQETILAEEPVRIYIREGRIASMEGKHAPLLEKAFQKYERRAKYPSRIRHACELGVGINPGAILLGSTIVDEKVLGTAHVAFGSNYWFGGGIKTLYHGDQVFKKPVFYVDGKKMDY